MSISEGCQPPRPTELADEPGVAQHQPLPVPKAGMVATSVKVKADEFDVRHRQDATAHFRQVLGGDA